MSDIVQLKISIAYKIRKFLCMQNVMLLVFHFLEFFFEKDQLLWPNNCLTLYAVLWKFIVLFPTFGSRIFWFRNIFDSLFDFFNYYNFYFSRGNVPLFFSVEKIRIGFRFNLGVWYWTNLIVLECQILSIWIWTRSKNWFAFSVIKCTSCITIKWLEFSWNLVMMVGGSKLIGTPWAPVGTRSKQVGISSGSGWLGWNLPKRMKLFWVFVINWSQLIS